MKILALGGAGDMGRTAVTTLVNAPSITSITVADRNYEVAERFASLVESERVSASQIDVTEYRKLVDLISQHDLVMSSVGPYYRFGPGITEACIEAGRSCADICDDWKPMLNVLMMDQKAKDAGVTIIPGIGASPGLSNLLAALGASEFDEVDEIVTAWGAGKSISGPMQPHHVKNKLFASEKKHQENAALMHLLHECLETVPTFRDGRIVHIESLSDAGPLMFTGYENAFAYHIGHPEPVTIPLAIKARSVSNVMFYEKPFMDLLRNFAQKIKSGTLSIEEAALRLSKGDSSVVISNQKPTNFPPPICVMVTGLKNGEKKRVSLGLTHIPYGQMAGSTGVPLAIATIMLAEGKITKKGVCTPESLIDPNYFLNKYAEYCGDGLSIEDILLKKEVNF